MASEDLVYKVGVDASDAVSGLRKLEGAVRSTMREVGDELDESATAGDKFAASVDRLATSMRGDFASAAVAAEELKRALRDAGSGLEVGDALAELKRMGISFDEITADADKFATALKQLDDVRISGVADLDSVAPGLATKLDDVSKSADSSRSALANMIGNSAQDLGDVAGIAGSLGVGIGQIGEYAADAMLAGEGLGSTLKNMATVAGPMAGLALATQLVGTALAGIKAEKTFRAGLVDKFADDMREAETVAESLYDTLQKTGDIEVTVPFSGGFLNLGAEAKSLLPIMEELGVGWDQLLADIKDPGAQERIRAMTEEMVFQGDEGERLAVLWNDYALGVDQYGDAWRDAQGQQEIANRLLAEGAEAGVENSEAMDKARDAAEKLAAEQREAVEAAREHQVALTNASRALGDVAGAMGEIRADAITSVFDAFGRPEADAGKIRDLAGAIAELPKTLADLEGADLGDVLAGSFEADPFLDAVDGIAGQMRERMAGAFAEGNAQGAKDIAESTIRDVVAAMEGKLTGEQVSTLLGLDDLQAQIDVAVRESAVESVKRQLAVLTGVAGESPLTASIALALDAGTITPEAAEILVQAQLGQAGVTVPSSLQAPDTAEALAEAGRFVADGIEIPTTADTTGAVRDVEGFARATEGDAPVEVPVDADVDPAERTAAGFRRTTEATRPSVTVDANTREAINTMLYLKILSAILAPTVTVSADTAAAASSIRGLRNLDVNVPVEAVLADYPTNAEIAAKIGRVRVPVDIVTGQTIRITGVRE